MRRFINPVLIFLYFHCIQMLNEVPSIDSVYIFWRLHLLHQQSNYSFHTNIRSNKHVMTFASNKGSDAFGILHGGLMGKPAGSRREKTSGAIILSIGGHISGYLYLSRAPC
jgi:hypothetical protein